MSPEKTLKDVMVPCSELKTVTEEDYFHDALMALNQNHWGAVFVTDNNRVLKGIITDGDVRRVYAYNKVPLAQLNSEPVKKYMNSKPTPFSLELPVSAAIKTMNSRGFLCAPIVNSDGKLEGIVHLQHLVTELLRQ